MSRLADMGLHSETFTDLYLNDPSVQDAGHQWKNNGSMGSLPDEHKPEADVIYAQAILQNRPVFSLNINDMRLRGQLLSHLSGVSVVLRRINGNTPRWLELGFPAGILPAILTGEISPNATFTSASVKKAGLIIVCGETDSGKSTTLATLLREILRIKPWVAVTIEDPVEQPLAGKHDQGYCYQQDVDKGEFSSALRNVLRVNPDIILVGEIRDPETAATCLSAAVTGHLVLSSIHAGNIPQGLQRILSLAADSLSLGEAKELLSQSLRVCVHQRLTKSSGSTRKLEASILQSNVAVINCIKGEKLDHLCSEIDRQKNLFKPTNTNAANSR
jgi:Tfp pilus assembly pilus retraction ATPase PilT